MQQANILNLLFQYHDRMERRVHWNVFNVDHPQQRVTEDRIACMA